MNYYYSQNPASYDPRDDYDYFTSENGSYCKLSDIPRGAKIHLSHDGIKRSISIEEFELMFLSSNLAQSHKSYKKLKVCNLTIDQLQRDGMKLKDHCEFCDSIVKDHHNPV